ncbi:alpha/beta fold hydrolase [Kitasatospora sp. NPDC056138]|uniref:alpha/beta fold hydrolase n=1 Tax=Kitasatospora sp. NPDC056138 TaxID=3345724 RepID=UPI0035D77E3D
MKASTQETTPRSQAMLQLRSTPRHARAAVVFLHGGRADSLRPPSSLNLPSLRMYPFASALRRRFEGQEVLFASARYRYRGWNGQLAHAAQDTRQALAELEALAPYVLALLVGHSMGGRAALAAARHPQVQGVVALAPWCPTGEPVGHLRGKTVVLLHDHDRITKARDSWAFAHRAEQAGALVRAVRMQHGGHAMLRDARRWHRLTADCAQAILDGTPLPAPPGTVQLP